MRHRPGYYWYTPEPFSSFGSRLPSRPVLRGERRPAVPVEGEQVPPAPPATAEPVQPAESAQPAEPTADRTDLRRALRDLEAAKQRVERDAERVLARTRDDLIGRLLPVLDNLDRSIAAANAANTPDGTPDGALLRGVELVRDQFVAVLAGYGVERIDALGSRFDPAEHEAVAVAEVALPEQDRTVVQVLQAGYRIDDRILRPARVQVGQYRHDQPSPLC
jgi:molecular chaperone GrpE